MVLRASCNLRRCRKRGLAVRRHVTLVDDDRSTFAAVCVPETDSGPRRSPTRSSLSPVSKPDPFLLDPQFTVSAKSVRLDRGNGSHFERRACSRFSGRDRCVKWSERDLERARTLVASASIGLGRSGMHRTKVDQELAEAEEIHANDDPGARRIACTRKTLQK